jgi:hypothetical protein
VWLQLQPLLKFQISLGDASMRLAELRLHNGRRRFGLGKKALTTEILAVHFWDQLATETFMRPGKRHAQWLPNESIHHQQIHAQGQRVSNGRSVLRSHFS